MKEPEIKYLAPSSPQTAASVDLCGHLLSIREC